MPPDVRAVDRLGRRTRALVLLVLCAVSFGSGLVISSIGPTIPEMARRAGTSPGGLGVLFSALFLGTLCAQCLTFLWADRVGLRPVLALGALLYGCSTVALALSDSIAPLIAAAFGMGLGWGCAGLAVNVLPRQIATRRLSAVLNLVNLCYAAGAITGPLLVALTLALMRSAAATLQVGGALLIACVPVALLLAPRGPVVSSAQASSSQDRLEASPRLWVLGALAFLYVGIENATGGWTATYLMRTLAVAEARAAADTAWFWIALAGGRLLGTLVGMRAGALALLRWSLAGAVGGSLLFLVGLGHYPLTLAGLVLLGAAFGPVYASLVELVTGAFPRRPSAAMSLASALGGIGGMLLPWIQGVSLERLGGRAMGGALLATTVAMAACARVAERLASGRGARGRGAKGGVKGSPSFLP